ncbi:Vacuolar protein sorting-associated protein 16 [Modicella reniformis]|uniref:Vacuolar protein sorting-associated protein 16 n=1 Tax=Modicella reniformis TaxID=1440133 RepID=A0A9P6LTR9_9FUNG|nr:Vacuolar protein sorting-associated protein 16 [Modicella reniformis]
MAKTPTADWFELQDRFYRKQEIYVMLWEQVDLSKYMAAAAPCGGPIALVRDDRKWDKGRIVGMGWTETEQLLCVFEEGLVRMYNILGESTQFSLGKVGSDSRKCVFDIPNQNTYPHAIDDICRRPKTGSLMCKYGAQD